MGCKDIDFLENAKYFRFYFPRKLKKGVPLLILFYKQIPRNHLSIIGNPAKQALILGYGF
jgi:hypothetical protein